MTSLRFHKPHHPNNDVPKEFEPGAPPVEPDEGPVPAPLPDGPEHERDMAVRGLTFVGPCRGLRVLAVDDNPVNLLTISALLASRGLVPVLAADGAEAVSLACELQFDLILMDLQMPILDGFGATSAIRRFETHNARPAVPVIAYSSASPGACVLTLHGFNGSLIKPCDEQELEDCLVQWCPAYRAAPSARVGDHGNSGWARIRSSNAPLSLPVGRPDPCTRRSDRGLSGSTVAR